MNALQSISRAPRTQEEAARSHREWMAECEMYHRIVSRIYATAMPRTTVEVNPDGSFGRIVRTDLVLPEAAQKTVDLCSRTIRDLAVARGLIQPTEDEA